MIAYCRNKKITESNAKTKFKILLQSSKLVKKKRGILKLHYLLNIANKECFARYEENVTTSCLKHDMTYSEKQAYFLVS